MHTYVHMCMQRSKEQHSVSASQGLYNGITQLQVQSLY